MTIYTSKKNGKSYTMQALENGKFQLTNTEDSSEVVTTTESVIKRWYKKSVVVDFTNVPEQAPTDEPAEQPTEEQPVEEPKAKKTRKARSKKAPQNTDPDNAIPMGYYRENVKHESISFEAANTLFGNLTIDRKTATASSDAFKSRRVYEDPNSGFVFIRNKGVLLEITGFVARV